MNTYKKQRCEGERSPTYGFLSTQLFYTCFPKFTTSCFLRGYEMNRKLGIALMGLWLTPALLAQLATTTSLVGTVSDSSGKVIPNAKVTAVETQTANTYTGVTNAQGYYLLDFVKVGTYNVTAESPGFQKVTTTGIIVDINQTVRTELHAGGRRVDAVGRRWKPRLRRSRPTTRACRR